MSDLVQKKFVSPLGNVGVVARGHAVVAVFFENAQNKARHALARVSTHAVLDQALDELAQYFDGIRTSFDVPIAVEGTNFQKRVWSALREIPYGQVCSYGEIARAVGNPKASRAVGMANHRNPIAIIVPCHRVIGSDGALSGYAGGVPIKQWLLRHEATVSKQSAASHMLK